MCDERERTRDEEATSEQNGTAGPSAAFRDGCLPNCCGLMIKRMMKVESSRDPENDSPCGERQPDTGASCASMMQRMMNTCSK